MPGLDPASPWTAGSSPAVTDELAVRQKTSPQPCARVRAALRAAAERDAADRFAAARLAWRDSAACDAALRGSRLSSRAFSIVRLSGIDVSL